ncbi:MAG: CoA-binding protein [Caldilineales bacterium]|nr:CoA-binding protein [Caldilineales bacterium]
MYDFLKKVPLFATLTDDDLSRLCEMVEEVFVPAGEDLFEEGAPGDKAYVVQEGHVEILKASGGRQVLLAVRGPGDVIGEMSLIEEAPRNATVRARTDVKFLAISQEQLDQLLENSPSAAKALLHTVLSRMRATMGMVRQGEKMAQLGTMTAGIAHELNNPAAAVKRGSGQLLPELATFGEAAAALARIKMDAEHEARLLEVAEEARAAATRPPNIDALARSDLEGDIEFWLEDRGFDSPWDLAPTLVSMGHNEASLDALEQDFSAEQMPIILNWLVATYDVHNLVAEISQGASRISEIVKALKSYSYLDQAPVQTVDIHEGLDNTLLILKSKLKEGITVRREYSDDVPKIQAYGSELNQVWTNIIDNAADALTGRPDATIILRTKLDGSWVIVDIEDNGPGIPKEIQGRIFDAFFTTKPPGKGTGMGLDISYNIIVNKHGGDIRVYSQPGKTLFRVALPVDMGNTDREPPALETFPRPTDEQMRRILETSHTVAVVGISSLKDKPSHSVPEYLQQHGYRIIPVNPSCDEVLGEKAYPDLLSIPEPVDVVQIFRRSEVVPEIVEQAIQIGAKVVWMQEGIFHEAAAERAHQAGLEVVMDACMRATHKYLIDTPAARA